MIPLLTRIRFLWEPLHSVKKTIKIWQLAEGERLPNWCKSHNETSTAYLYIAQNSHTRLSCNNYEAGNCSIIILGKASSDWCLWVDNALTLITRHCRFIKGHYHGLLIWLNGVCTHSSKSSTLIDLLLSPDKWTVVNIFLSDWF